MAASPSHIPEMENSVSNGDTHSQRSQDTHSHTSQDSVGSSNDSTVPPVILRARPSCKTNGCHVNNKDEILRRRSASVLEVKEHQHTRLQEELIKTLQELKIKDEECKKLTDLQELMTQELQDLTASLFEEANKMVQEANVKRINQEKLLKEANAKTEVLQAEVTALKSLVITSTPSMPNRHLHPQLEPAQQPQPGPSPTPSSGPARFIKGHRRSTSHHNISREIQLSEIAPTAIPVPPAWPLRETQSVSPREFEREVNPVYFVEFKRWRDNSPNLDINGSPFLERVIREDIRPCLAFPNTELATAVFDSIIQNTLTIDPVQERNPFPSQCALTESCQVCRFKLRLGENAEPGHLICPLARNRITAVCDFITYLRYICQGIVKSDERDIYWEIMRLQKQICLARLGFS